MIRFASAGCPFQNAASRIRTVTTSRLEQHGLAAPSDVAILSTVHLIVAAPGKNRQQERTIFKHDSSPLDAEFRALKTIRAYCRQIDTEERSSMELRHLRYFTAVVQWKGYREASRQLHVAQPAISRTVADLEDELGLKLFSRTNRTAQLTPEGEVFYAEAVRTLAQAESAINTARRAAKGEIGKLSIGFLGSEAYAFLPELVRTFKSQYPDVKLTLQELTPLQQETAFERGAIDIGFTRTLTPEQRKIFSSRCLYRDPMMAVLPASRQIQTERVCLSDLAKERFVLFHREGAPPLFDTIISMCKSAGFSPQVDCEPNIMQTVLTLVEAVDAVSIVPACVRNLRSDGVRFYRLQPDEVRVELVAAWKKEAPSVALRAFLDLLDTKASLIRKKAELR
jgi:DNA-binding transcriptional LysR family regulator